ncbi:MAG TPA: AAA family ATPase [Candidatus Babeliales bacterium]|nr:AAA family ATPase [Candidatus Babeliales bacterium]
MIITIGGIKGGCGKSLIATNLTVIRAKQGKNVLLVDADEQETTADWTNHRYDLGIKIPWTTIRLKANAVRTEILKLASNYDDIIIDCGGRDTTSLRAALTVSDVFLVPFQPKSFDIWTTRKVTSLIAEVNSLNNKLQSYAFINCAGSRGTDNDDAKKILSCAEGLQLLPVTIGLRKAFSNATADGLGVVEQRKDKKAITEIHALYNSIFKPQEETLK